MDAACQILVTFVCAAPLCLPRSESVERGDQDRGLEGFSERLHDLLHLGVSRRICRAFGATDFGPPSFSPDERGSPEGGLLKRDTSPSWRSRDVRAEVRIVSASE